MHQVIPQQGTPFTIRLTIAYVLIFLLYGVGAVGLSMADYQAWFLGLTPLQLLFSLGILLFFHRGWTDAFPIFGAAVFWIGFGAEWLGVHTGLLFGDYVYGTTLGPKLWDIPIIIGVNWFILTYLTGSVFHRIPNDTYAAFLGALSMTALDYILEPVAVELDFWYWKFDHIPVQNYLGWFGVSFIVHLLFRKANFEKYNPVALVLLLTMIVFFVTLNFTIL